MSILWVLAVPVLFCIANLVDKYQLDGDGEDSTPNVIVALGGLFALFLAIPLGLWMYFTGMDFGGMETLVPLLFNEILYVGAIWIYCVVTKKEEVSRVVPWFQTIPAFGLVAGIALLGEFPGSGQLLAIAMLVLGGFVLSFHKGGVKVKLVALMLLSAAMFAANDAIFARFGREMSNTGAIFVNLVGKAFWGFLFLVGKGERRGFKLGLRTKFRIQAISELAALVADILLCLFLLYFPVAIVQGMCCIQPLCVFAGAMLLVKVSKRGREVLREEISYGTTAQKAIGIVLMVAGGIVLSS